MMWFFLALPPFSSQEEEWGRRRKNTMSQRKRDTNFFLIILTMKTIQTSLSSWEKSESKCCLMGGEVERKKERENRFVYETAAGFLDDQSFVKWNNAIKGSRQSCRVSLVDCDGSKG